jgi:hypothetical protein
MRFQSKNIIAVSLTVIAISFAALAIADPVANPNSESEQLRKAIVNYNTQCTGVKANSPEAQWCAQEKARIAAWQQLFNQNSQGNQDQQ